MPTRATRTPPHDTDAEESLLGACLLARDAITTSQQAGITPADFHDPNHARIWTAIVGLHDQDRPVDVTSLGVALNSSLDKVGGRRRLLQLLEGTPASANAAEYARVVHELAGQRALADLAGRLVDALYDHQPTDHLVGQLHELTALDDTTDGWAPIDLLPALAQEERPVAPAVFERDDHVRLFPLGKVNGIHADSGVGKSWVAAIAAAQEIRAGHHVIWVDMEDPDETTLVARLRDDLAVDPDAILEHLHYIAPHDPFDTVAVARLANLARDTTTTFLVIDSIGEAFGLAGIDENKDVDVGPWYRMVARPLADAGPAVLIIDHSTKAADNPLHPSGSKRKRAGMTGASYLVEAPAPLTREKGGKLRLTCAKDRHGQFRRGEEVAVIDFTKYPDGGLWIKVWPPSSPSVNNTTDQRVLTVARAAVRAAKNATHPLSLRGLIAEMKVTAGRDLKIAAIEKAIALGAIRTETSSNRQKLHVYVQDLPTQEQLT